MTAIAHPDDAQAARRTRGKSASARTGETAIATRRRPLSTLFTTFRLNPEDIVISPSEVARDLEYGRD